MSRGFGRPGNSGGPPPWLWAVAGMLSVQLSSALSVGLIDQVGSAGAAWLRLSMGALLLLLIARPPLRSIRRSDLPALLTLGIGTGLMTTAFLAAVDRIPLGTAVAIEFLGPLSVAALRGGPRRIIWPLLALLGVVLLTEPWHGEVDVVGVACAAAAGAGWGLYVLLTQRVGDRFSGISGLAVTVPVAALAAAVVGVPQAAGRIELSTVALAAGLALLAPVAVFGLEMLALRRMTHTAFGTLMAVEPAFGVLLGLMLLHQIPGPAQILGIVIVVLAGAAAQRGGRRTPELPAVDAAPPASGLEPRRPSQEGEDHHVRRTPRVPADPDAR
ncbi:EamA family transporter [Nesterenkonia halophila]